MITTSHLVVYDAAVAALAKAPALAGGHIKTMRSTNRRMPDGVTSQLRVFIDQSNPFAHIGGNAPVDWTTRLRIECMARDTVGTTPTSALDTATLLAAQVQQRLLTDIDLSLLISEISPGPFGWAEDEADTQLTACQCLITLTHRTAFETVIVQTP
jgi:hypothetical protein